MLLMFTYVSEIDEDFVDITGRKDDKLKKPGNRIRTAVKCLSAKLCDWLEFYLNYIKFTLKNCGND